MKKLILILFAFLSMTGYSQDFNRHEVSFGQRLYMFFDWGLSEPISEFYFNRPDGFLHSVSYGYRISEEKAFRLNYNFYFGEDILANRNDNRLDKRIDARFFRTFALAYEKQLRQSTNKQHKLNGALGVAWRTGYEVEEKKCFDFECNDLLINLSSPGITYALTYRYQPATWFSLNAILGGDFYYPSKEQFSTSVSRRSHFWQGHFGLYAGFHF